MTTTPTYPLALIKRELKKLISFPKSSYCLRKIAQLGFWFIDIPRTSSTSIKMQLADQFGLIFAKKKVFGGRAGTKFSFFPSHRRATDMIEFMGEAKWKQLKSFSIVRNPYERMFSLYQYRLKLKEIPGNIKYEDYILQVVRAKQGLPTHGVKILPIHYYSNWNFIADKTGNIAVTHIVDFSRRKTELPEVLSDLGLSIDLEVHYQASIRSRKVEAPKLSIIYDGYREDFEQLGYFK